MDMSVCVCVCVCVGLSVCGCTCVDVKCQLGFTSTNTTRSHPDCLCNLSTAYVQLTYSVSLVASNLFLYGPLLASYPDPVFLQGRSLGTRLVHCSTH